MDNGRLIGNSYSTGNGFPHYMPTKKCFAAIIQVSAVLPILRKTERNSRDRAIIRNKLIVFWVPCFAISPFLPKHERRGMNVPDPSMVFSFQTFSFSLLLSILWHLKYTIYL